jgi:DNA-binding response OmpR family regulator
MKIMILEDDTALCNGIEIALAAHDRQFLSCHSIAAASRQIRGRPVEPAIYKNRSRHRL